MAKVPQPTPQAPSAVQVLRRKATPTGWVEEWVDLSDDISTNRIDGTGTRTLDVTVPPPADVPETVQLSTITDNNINELSAMAYSRTWDDTIYVTNDENSSPQVYTIQPSTGTVIGQITLNQPLPSNGDPEAMCMDTGGRVWLADIGDNKATRHNIALYVFQEPGPGNHTVTTTKYPLSYPNGKPRNAECFMIHPTSGVGYIITKASTGQLFQLGAFNTNGTVMVNRNIAMPAYVTDGVFTKDGAYVLLRLEGKQGTWVYRYSDWKFMGKVPSPELQKGEAVTMEPDGYSFLLGSEGDDSPIWRVGLPTAYWPATTVTTITVPDYALQLRAKMAEEDYPENVATKCRRLVVWYLRDGNTTWVRHPESSWAQEGRWKCGPGESAYQYFSVSMPVGVHYQVRVVTENYMISYSNGQGYRQQGSDVSGSVWSNRYPTATPATATGRTTSDTAPFTVSWRIDEDDVNSAQNQYGLQVRRAGYGANPPATTYLLNLEATDYYMEVGGTATYDIDIDEYPENMWYEWRVIVKDYELWSPWSEWRSFFIVGTELPPIPLSPTSDISVDLSNPDITFVWDFRDDDPTPGPQYTASIRYRVVDAEDWTTIVGDAGTPGANESWSVPSDTFLAGFHYEWQVQTESSSASGISPWSVSATFWTAPPTAVVDSGNPVFKTLSQGTLGCGTYRVFVYDRGGQIRRGEITPIRQLQWDRRRDDISQATIHTNGFGEDCAALLRTLHCWMHEIVIYRDNNGVSERVWEGPITRIAEHDDHIEIDARDVMNYVYRRILRTGYNDAYPNSQTVVFRSTRIIQDALAYDDPNVLGYLTPIYNTGDAKESRIVAPYSKSSWEEVDDMAANAGLDYTVVGRRIILWDVHQEIGRLPEMRNGDFTDPVVVTEYGMLTAGVFAVTNNAGVYGLASAYDTDPGPYGFIEQIASSYGESDAAATEALTPAALAALTATLNEQANRNIAGRYPNPVIVRVPDNTTVMSNVEIGLDQLVPGVRIPLRSVGKLREITQVQKLDRLTVTYTADEQEKIKVVLSPAPDASVETEPEAPPE